MPDPIRLDTAARQAWQGDREIHLPHLQYEILAHLTACAGQVVTQRHLLQRVWNTDWPGNSKTITVHIGRLRRALGDNARQSAYITTVPSVGYRFEAAMLTATPPPPADGRTPVLILPLPVSLGMVGAILAAAAPEWEARYGCAPTTEHLVERVTPWGAAAALLPPTEKE